MPKPESNLELDAIDHEILKLLRSNARRTFGDLGKNVGLSSSATKRRVDRLERSGVITGYTVKLDHSRLGAPIEAFTEVRFSGSVRVDAIATLGKDIPEVQQVFTIAGDPDALVWLRVRNVDDLKRVVDQLRSSGQVTGTKTLMVLGTSPADGTDLQ